MSKKPALGRGLSALLEDQKTDITQKEKVSTEKNSGLGCGNCHFSN